MKGFLNADHGKVSDLSDKPERRVGHFMSWLLVAELLGHRTSGDRKVLFSSFRSNTLRRMGSGADMECISQSSSRKKCASLQMRLLFYQSAGEQPSPISQARHNLFDAAHGELWNFAFRASNVRPA